MDGLEAHEFADRLQAVAVEVAMPTGPGLDDAIRLAEDLIAAGHDAEATLEVAAMHLGSPRSDAEPGVRAMLTEHGIIVPEAEDEPSRYRLLLEAFGFLNLRFDLFEGPFYARLLSWDRQDSLDQKLVLLLYERDQVSGTTEREQIETKMRAVVREHLAVD